MIFRLLAILLVVACAKPIKVEEPYDSGDSTYRILFKTGRFERTKNPCGEAVRKQVINFVRDEPIVRISSDAFFVTHGASRYKANRRLNFEGNNYGFYDKIEDVGMAFHVMPKDSRKAQIRASILRRDGRLCHETWIGQAVR